MKPDFQVSLKNGHQGAALKPDFSDSKEKWSPGPLADVHFPVMEEFTTQWKDLYKDNFGFCYLGSEESSFLKSLSGPPIRTSVSSGSDKANSYMPQGLFSGVTPNALANASTFSL